METCSAITPQPGHNYVAFFLSFACNLSCDYCINLHDRGSRSMQARRRQMSPAQWVLPLTLQGGEPTLHPGFYRFVNEVKPDLKMDLMTNLMFDVDRFIREVPVWRFTREAPYAAIRVSYHPGQNDIDDLIRSTFKLQDAGFRIGLYGIEHPDQEMHRHIEEVQARCLGLGLDFRTKEFLGEHQGVMLGTFKYDGCVTGAEMKDCECRTTELIVDPSGFVYRCHSDLYRGREPIAHILDPAFNEEWLDEFRPCSWYGDCNPCDVKVKTNRFQIFGHTSVEIRKVTEKTWLKTASQ